jgi:putative transcriptional regulator
MAEPSQHEPKIRLQGRVLLASPVLSDGVFDHSVIFLAEHDPKQGAFGLILNHPTGQTVGELLSGDEFEPLRHLAVHFGGPVSNNNLTFSAFWWNEQKGLRSAIRISAEDAVHHAKRPGALVRAFAGYSGWSGGQLENELQRDSWIVTPAPPTLLGTAHDQHLWTSILRGLSPYHRILAEAPKNPLAN